MAGEDNQQGNPQQQEASNVKQNIAFGAVGMNMDSSISQVKKGQLTYALNATLEGFSGNQVNYQNELGNEHCINFPQGYQVIGTHNIFEINSTVYFLANPTTGGSEIGLAKDCVYETKYNSECLGFNINYPIHSCVHRINNCNIEIYFIDGNSQDKYLDFNNIPAQGDCNKLNIQPNFAIPKIDILGVENDGTTTAGTVEFAFQYCTALGEPYTSFYSITNPVPLFDSTKVTADFNFPVGKSVKLQISNIDTTGIYQYFNLAVIKTINNVPTPELLGTYLINSDTQTIIYTGQSKTDVRLTIGDIFQKYPIYPVSNDITTSGDVLIRNQIKEYPRLNYQEIASKIRLYWQTWRIPVSKGYINPITTTNNKGYMRDEVYPIEAVLLLRNGKQTDKFVIPGRKATSADLVPISNSDNINTDVNPTWKVYNTGSVIGYEDDWNNSSKDNTYFGAYQYGEFAYWESSELYPNKPEMFGDLANTPIRHHKFPDSSVTHIHDINGNIYPIGIKIDIDSVKRAIESSSLSQEEKNDIVGFKIVRGDRANNKSIVGKGLLYNVGKATRENTTYYFANYPYNDLSHDPFIDGTVYDNDSKNRFTFHSPDTSFFQPSLGTLLKLETVEYGKSSGEFVQVKNHAKYKLYSIDSYLTASLLGVALGFSSMWLIGGLADGGQVFNGVAAMSAYQTLVDIFQKITPRTNPCYQYNSVGDYSNFLPIPNNGNKQRTLALSSYIVPGVQSVSDEHNINNWQRESSVYIKTNNLLPYTHELTTCPSDNSRYIMGSSPANDIDKRDISSFYGSLKNIYDNQYGQLGSYETVDTGFQYIFSSAFTKQYETIFGGDTFINKFGFKKKLPFFIDNRVGTAGGVIDDSDIFYNDLGNIGYPNYWFSTDATVGSGWLGTMFGLPTTGNLDNRKQGFFNVTGQMYLFAYGIPYFYCESQVNVDYRQAYDNKAGDYYPHAGTGIPNDWLTEVNTSIAFDNTYVYNKTFSKQNAENYFSTLPLTWTKDTCQYIFPYKAVYSEPRLDTPNTGQRNNWLIYKPVSFFDFPQNYGKLISLEGVENKGIVARFENKTLMYNTMLTIDTSTPQAAYLGNDKLFKSSPPVDIRDADTDLGYVGQQNHIFIKTEFGNITVDAKRGQIFAINSIPYRGLVATDLTSAESGMSKFFTNNLDFKILKYFPDIDTDNHFKGIGLHGVYDSKYNRLIITKLDYEPIVNGIVYDGSYFYYGGNKIDVRDNKYFVNRSFTASFDFDNKSWVSFHSYIPNYYVGWNNYFFSGRNNINGQSDIWKHLSNQTITNNFYGVTCPYTIEYPFSYQMNDEILQNVKDYTKALKYNSDGTYIEVDNTFFNKAILYNNQGCSGLLELVPKPKNNLSEYMKYPMYNIDSKTIVYTKSDNFYNYNTFWSMIKDKSKPIFLPSSSSLSIDKELNQANMDYSKRSFKKEPLRAKDLKIRHTLDNCSDTVLVSQFIIAPSQTSYK